MDDRAVRDGRLRANGDCRAGLGMDDHPILNVRVRTDDDGLHVVVCIDLVGSDHRIGSDEDSLIHDHTTAENGRWVDKRTLVDVWDVAARISSDHRNATPARCALPGCTTPKPPRSQGWQCRRRPIVINPPRTSPCCRGSSRACTKQLGNCHGPGHCWPRLQKIPQLTAPPPRRTVGAILDGDTKRRELGTNSIRGSVVSRRPSGPPAYRKEEGLSTGRGGRINADHHACQIG